MNWVDFSIGVLAVLFFITGIRMGFIREVTGLIGFVLAFVLAVAGTPIWADSMVDMLNFPPSVAKVSAFILIFALVYLLCKAGGKFLFKFIRHSPLDLLDRLGGSIIGLLKGALVISLVLVLLGILPLPDVISEEINSSQLAYPLRTFAPASYDFLKEAFPQLRSLGEIVGQSVEDGVARGKEIIKEESSQMVDKVQKARATREDGKESAEPSQSGDNSAEEK